MNRKSRRKLDKTVGVKGFGTVVSAMSSGPVFSEGDRVVIRYEQIVNRKDFAAKNDLYKVFLEENRDKVFTIHKVSQGKDHSLIELVEDPSVPKWLWWEGDLCRVDKT